MKSILKIIKQKILMMQDSLKGTFNMKVKPEKNKDKPPNLNPRGSWSRRNLARIVLDKLEETMRRKINYKKIISRLNSVIAVLGIIVFAFAPIGELARQYLPENVAGQIAKITPKVKHAYAHPNDVVIFLTTASDSKMANWPVPADWNPASNSIEVIGGGGAGGDGTGTAGAGGGGGGGYGKIFNLTFAAASISAGIPFAVGASGAQPTGDTLKGGDGGHTWFGKSTFALCNTAGQTICVSAEGGGGGRGSVAPLAFTGGTGGNTSSASGTTEFAGGNGGLGHTNDAMGGGGGAAGPRGAGKIGGAGGTTSNDGGGGGGGSNGGSSDVGLIGGSSGIGGNGGPNDAGSAGGIGGNATYGAAGVNPGSGGGGGGTTFNGGYGASGSFSDWRPGHGPGGGGGGVGDPGGGSTQIGGRGGAYGGGGGGGAVCNTPTDRRCRGGNGIIVIKYTPLTVQKHFRLYSEGGTLDSPTSPVSAEDVAASGSEALNIDSIYRVRFSIANNASVSLASKFRLEMTRKGTSCTSKASGWTWMTVPLANPTASQAFEVEATDDFVDGASTSVNILTAAEKTFTDGYGFDNRATSGFQTHASDRYTELDYAIMPTSGANTSATYCFRLTRLDKMNNNTVVLVSSSYDFYAKASVQAALPPSSTLAQSAFRFFENNNSTQIGGPLANTNASASVPNQTGDFRLRMTINVSTANLSQSGQAFKLQTARKGSGTCVAPQFSYVDVDGTSSISYNDNPGGSVTDDVVLNPNALDPTGTGTRKEQTYEESNNFTNSISAVNTGEYGLWDFSLKEKANLTDNQAYCFKIVKSSGSALNTYSIFPEIISFNTAVIPGQVIRYSGSGGGGGSGGDSGGGAPLSGGGANSGNGGCAEPPCGGGGAPTGGGGSDGGGGGASPVLYILYSIWKFLSQTIF